VDEQVNTVVQRGVLIVSDLTNLAERGMHAGPDWLEEILAPTTAGHDEIVKRPVYERAGVRPAWIVHATDRSVSIDLLVGGQYGAAAFLERMGHSAIRAIPRGGDRLGPRTARDGLAHRSAIVGSDATAASPIGARVRGAPNRGARSPAVPAVAGCLTVREGPTPVTLVGRLSRANLFLFGRGQGINRTSEAIFTSRITRSLTPIDHAAG
jgi:hypothetical protein